MEQTACKICTTSFTDPAGNDEYKPAEFNHKDKGVTGVCTECAVCTCGAQKARLGKTTLCFQCGSVDLAQAA